MKDRLEAVTKTFARRCDYFEVHAEETEESRVAFAGDALTDLGMKVDFGGNVRACYRGGWGFVSFNSLDKIETFAEAAIDQAKRVGRDQTTLADVEPATPDGDVSFVAISPESGRTNQIRVHAAHIGHPVLGDKIYGVPPALAREFVAGGSGAGDDLGARRPELAPGSSPASH